MAVVFPTLAVLSKSGRHVLDLVMCPMAHSNLLLHSDGLLHMPEGHINARQIARQIGTQYRLG